jgi:hypothetical protein
MKKSKLLLVFISILISSCVSQPPPKKIIPPTKIVQVEKEEFNKAEKFIIFLAALVEAPQYNSNNSVMHRYLRSLYVEIEEPYFGVLVQRDVDNEEEFIMLGADILRAASMFSYESKLYITYIYIVSPGPNNSSVTLYLNGYDVISDTAEGKVNIYDVMEVEVDYGDS